MTAPTDRRPANVRERTGIPALTLTSITKQFNGVAAIRDVSLSVSAGEIVGLIGENGAGKSTLMKVAAGVYPSDTHDGTVEVDGVILHAAGVKDAEDAGIVLIAQELQVAPDLSIAENMFVGSLPRRRVVLDTVRLHQRARKYLQFFGIDTAPSLPAKTLGSSEQRLMLIAGALSKNAKVLILDEPTAALTDHEADTLFAHLRQLAQQGVAIIFITHRLDEIDRLARRIVVMRNGTRVEEFGPQPDRGALVRAMLGRHLAEADRQRQLPVTHSDLPVALQLTNVSVADPDNPQRLRVRGADILVRQGEIVGLYGLIGAGRTELLSAVYGSWPGRVDGEVTVGADPYPRRSPRHSIARGMALLTEDRKATGNIHGHSLQVNLSAANLGTVSRSGVINTLHETRRNRSLIERLNVQPPGLDRPIDRLSGGNQQKVLLGRTLATKPVVLLLDEPTLGVDIGSRFQMYEYIRELARQGMAILLASSDIDEVHTECDRILVMYKGRITGEFGRECQRDELLAAATGGSAE
jgi:ABC-type sugar transport system ATPase subunit